MIKWLFSMRSNLLCMIFEELLWFDVLQPKEGSDYCILKESLGPIKPTSVQCLNLYIQTLQTCNVNSTDRFGPEKQEYSEDLEDPEGSPLAKTKKTAFYIAPIAVQIIDCPAVQLKRCLFYGVAILQLLPECFLDNNNHLEHVAAVVPFQPGLIIQNTPLSSCSQVQ